MMSRPSFTASIGPSPVLGFMAAMRSPFVDVSPIICHPRWSAEIVCLPTSRSDEDHGGDQSAPSTPQHTRSHPTWRARNTATSAAR